MHRRAGNRSERFLSSDCLDFHSCCVHGCRLLHGLGNALPNLLPMLSLRLREFISRQVGHIELNEIRTHLASSATSNLLTLALRLAVHGTASPQRCKFSRFGHVYHAYRRQGLISKVSSTDSDSLLVRTIWSSSSSNCWLRPSMHLDLMKACLKTAAGAAVLNLSIV